MTQLVHHEVHFLTLGVVNNRLGWLTPLELSQVHQQGATHVVPVDQKLGLFPGYRVEFARCSSGGRHSRDWSDMDLQPSGFLKALIASWSIRFQMRMENGQPVVFDYVGVFTHPDFRLRLAEIIPEDESQLEDLYVQGNIVIVGCDPLKEYGGVNALHLTSPSRGA